MKTKSLWKRIFGQTDKKVRAQAAFQEQFETKLQFRELEPRVVLAADATFDAANNLSITITGNSNEQIEFSRNAIGNLILTGIDSLNGGAAGSVTFGLTQFNAVSILNSGTGETSVTFAGGADNLDGTFANSLLISNVDSILVELGSDFEITGFFQVDSLGQYENDSQLDLQGKVSAQAFHAHVQNNTGASLTVQSSASGQLETEFFHAYEDFGPSGELIVDLGSGSHDIDIIEANGREVELSVSDINDITLATISASKLSVTAGTQGAGSIVQQAGTAVIVNDSAINDPAEETATFIANGDINLGNAGNNFAGTVSASGEDITLRDSNTILLGEIVASTLDVTAGGSIRQTEGGEKITVSGSTQLELTNTGDVDLQYGANSFVGINMLGANFLNSFHLRDDSVGAGISGITARLASGVMQDFSLLRQNWGDFVLPAINIQGNLAVRGGGSLEQTAAWQVGGTTNITVGAGSHLSLTHVNNGFGAAVSVNGGTARAGLVQIFDNTGDLVLGDIHATDLVADSQGAILQDAAGIDILQTTVLVAGDGSLITLDSTNNVLAGSISAEGQTGAAGAVSIHNTMATALASVHGATLTVHSEGAIQQQSGTIQATSASLNVASGAAITLDKLNQIGTILAEGAAGSAAGDVVIMNNGSLALDTIHANSLTVTLQNAGDLSNTATSDITVSGLTTLTATNILLGENLGNAHDFGTVTLTTAGNATLLDSSGDLTFVGDSHVGGNLVAAASAGSVLQSGGKLEIDGTSHFTAKSGAFVTLDESDNVFGGSLSASVGATGTVTIATGSDLKLGTIATGTFAATATNSNITDTFGQSITVASLATLSGKSVVLGEPGHDLLEVTLTATASSEIVETNGFAFVGNSTVGDDLTVTSGGAIVDTTTTKISVADEAWFTGGLITLNQSNDKHAFSSLRLTTAGVADIVEFDGFSFFGNTSVGNNLSVASGGAILQSDGKIAVAGESAFHAAGAISLTSLLNDFNSNGDAIGSVSATGTAVDLVDTNSIILGDIDAQNLSVTASAGSITQTGPTDKIVVATNSQFTATGAITLANITNDFTGSVSATGTAIDLVDANSVLLGDIDAQNLSVTAAAGSITQTGPADKILVANESHFTATGAITLANITNDFTGSVSATGTAVGLVDANSIILGDIGAQSLSVTASAGSITQTGPADKILVANESHFTATGAITLANNTNDFTGSVSAAGTAVELVDANSIILGDINVQSLAVTAAAGSITQTGPADKIAVATTSQLTATGAITLANITNDFTGAVSATGTAVELVDVNSIILGDIDAQNLAVTASAGSITQTGPADKIAVANESHFTATGAITLANNTNDFTGSVSAAGTAVELVDANSIILGDIDVQSLSVTASAGSITQTGPADKILVANESHFTATGAITLANNTNDFTGSVSAAGTAVELVDANSILLGNINAQSLSVTATAGSITQTGPADKIVVATTSQFTATGEILLGNATNDFMGFVNATGTAIELSDANSIILGNINAQSLSVTAAAGSITQTGPVDKILVANNSQFTATGGITLLNSTNDFNDDGDGNGSVAATGTDVAIRDVNSISLGEISAASFQVVAGGDVTQSSSGEKLTVTGKTDIHLTGAGSVDLQYGANKLTDTVTLKLDDIAHLQNFHLRNEDASATTPSGDLAEALAIGNVINLSFLFPVAGSLVLAEDPDGGGFDEIDILGDLYVELGGSLTQKGSIYVDGSAHFQAGTINLAQTGNLDVDFDASFKATAGDIQVGVTTEAREAFIRGADSGQTVNFGTLSFEAAGYDVTIAEDSKVDLVGQNKAQSLVLASTTAGIADSAATSLTVSDLASFKADVGNIILQQGVDLRIVYASAKGDVAIVDSSLSDGLNIVDGTTADGGTLAIESNGHILQINDFRMGAPVDAQIVADSAIFHSDGSVLLTDLKVSHLAGAAGAAINVSVNEADIVSNALVNKQDGFGTILEIDAIDQLLPVAAGDPFAPQGPNPARAISGDYSFIAVNNGSLTIENVAGVGDVANHLGIKAEGQGAGHVFLRAKGAGANLDFKGSAGKENVIDLANSGILTALAEGELSIAANTELISRTGNVDGIVREIYKFEEQVNSGNNPELGGGFGIVDDISFGPTYIRELASKDADHQDPNTTLFLRIVNGIDTKANVTLTQLGIDGEQDLQVTVNWGDETETFLFSDAIANEKLSHFFSDDFLALNPVFTVTVTAYNSPLINLYENVESGNGSPRSLNVIQDQILMKVIIAEIWVPEVTEFVPPTNPIPQMAPIVTYTVSQVTTQVEFTDDTRVATPIDGVSVVEVNRNDPDMAIGDEVQLGDEFMTLDAVKEQIQRDERFRPGLYRITILYPGVETPQVFLFEKQIRATPIDIFGSNTPRQPQRPQVDQVAEAAQNAATAEEVWAREYEKWFPTVVIEYAGEDNVPEDAEGRVPADERQGQISPDAEVLLERVSLLDLQEVERLSERLRAQRSIVRDSLNGALVGGAALMAAAAVQRRGDEAHSVVGEEPPHEVRGGSLGRLQRRLRQWL